MLQAQWRASGSRKWCLSWFAVFPRGARIHPCCLPCRPQWPPQPHHAVGSSAGRHRHFHTGKMSQLLETPPASLFCWNSFPGSPHLCTGKLSPSAQQLHQLPSRPGKPLPASAGPASWVAVRYTRQRSLLCCLTRSMFPGSSSQGFSNLFLNFVKHRDVSGVSCTCATHKTVTDSTSLKDCKMKFVCV